MEAMNDWLSFPMLESFNQDMAIRRFCAARALEQEQRGEWEETLNEIELWSTPDENSGTPFLGTAEEEEFVDSFINMDCYEEDGEKLPEKYQSSCENFCNDIEIFSMVDDVYGGVLMIESIEGHVMEIGGSLEDLGVTSKVGSSVEEVSHGVDEGLNLVHLLLACAEAVGCRDTQLANSIVNKIWESVSPFGDSLQRVSFCFAAGLKSRLSLLYSVGTNGTLNNVDVEVPMITREEKMEAFHFLYQTTPYIAFGFMAANEAICHAAQGKESLHIIDIGMEHTLQWPSLVRFLISRPRGPPKLRITGIINDSSNHLELQIGMKALIDDASSLGMVIEFHLISEPAAPSLWTGENLGLREGELLFVNSIMQLHKYVKESRGSLKAILQAIRKLNPTLLTVVEQDANHNGPFFLGRFLESLHYYSAIFDSLEASLPRHSQQRMKIERLHFAEEIRNIVAYEASDRVERHERADQWRRQLGRAGFQVMGLKSMSQIRMMLSIYGCDGYTLANEKGCLLLGWKERPIMLASAWKVHSLSSS